MRASLLPCSQARHAPQHHHERLACSERRSVAVRAVSASIHNASPAVTRRASKSPLATRLSKCADLASIHALLLEEAGRAPQDAPGVASGPGRTQLVAGTRPSDAVAAFRHLSVSWSSSAQGPLDAALLADALRPAYALLNAHLPALQPREVAAIITSLAGLRSASPEVLRRLADSLLRRPAAAAAAAAPPPPLNPTFPAPPEAAAPAAAALPAAAQSPPSQPPPASSSAPGLTRLTVPELAAVVAALAAFNLRPGDAWLGLAMSSLQLGLPGLSGPQLTGLLWALVQLGVRPTSPWLALYEQALSDCLDRHMAAAAAAAAAAKQRRRPRSVQQSRAAPPAAEASAAAADGGGGGSGGGGGGGLMSCEELVRVVSAAAEVGFQPGERCRGLLLGSLGGVLGAMQPHEVAGLAWAMTRLGWRVDAAWRDTFMQVTSSQLPKLRAADLAPVLAFVAGAGLAPDRAWLRRCLQASSHHLNQVSPRDLPYLLMDLTHLDPQLFKDRKGKAAAAAGAAAAADAPAAAEIGPLQESEPESEPESGALAVEAGAGAVQQGGEAAGGMRGRVKGKAGEEAEAEGELEALAASWLRRYLQLCREKLSRFTAAGVARMMVAVARAGGRLDDRWLQAACAALASKSDVLAPTDMADALTALAALRRQALQTTRRGRQPAETAAAPAPAAPAPAPAPVCGSPSEGRASREQRHLLESLLAGAATKLSLLPDDRLVGLVAAVAELELLPPGDRGRGTQTQTQPVWLTALLDKTLVRLERSCAVAASAVPSAAALSPRLLSELLVAMAKLGVVPPRRWVGAFLEAAGRQMGGFDAGCLTGLMWGLVVLQVRPPAPWTRALLERVNCCLGESEGRSDRGRGRGQGRAGGGVSASARVAGRDLARALALLGAGDQAGDLGVRVPGEEVSEALGRAGVGVGLPRLLPAAAAAAAASGGAAVEVEVEGGVRRAAAGSGGEGEGEGEGGRRVRRARRPYGYLPRRRSAASALLRRTPPGVTASVASVASG
ncbi:hypothetical protein PLESTM_001860900 [Pleodorina starrii]|nr:hypothetical protein PLESTM_001860900 [Pleodorina starrii]